jgi:hypothetical protein
MNDRGRQLGRAVLDAVDQQIRSNDPPETRQTFDRLVASGHSEDEARRLIGTALAVEIFNIMKHEQEFDRVRFARNLARLPQLPAGDAT